MSALSETSDPILIIQDGSTDKGKLFWWHSASCKEVWRIVLQMKEFGIMILRKESTCLPVALP